MTTITMMDAEVAFRFMSIDLVRDFTGRSDPKLSILYLHFMNTNWYASKILLKK